jgi:hypothetical protein
MALNPNLMKMLEDAQPRYSGEPKLSQRELFVEFLNSRIPLGEFKRRTTGGTMPARALFYILGERLELLPDMEGLMVQASNEDDPTFVFSEALEDLDVMHERILSVVRAFHDFMDAYPTNDLEGSDEDGSDGVAA